MPAPMGHAPDSTLTPNGMPTDCETTLGASAGTVRLESKLHSILTELSSVKSSLAHERTDNMRLREASVMKVGVDGRPLRMQNARWTRRGRFMQTFTVSLRI